MLNILYTKTVSYFKTLFILAGWSYSLQGLKVDIFADELIRRKLQDTHVCQLVPKRRQLERNIKLIKIRQESK